VRRPRRALTAALLLIAATFATTRGLDVRRSTDAAAPARPTAAFVSRRDGARSTPSPIARVRAPSAPDARGTPRAPRPARQPGDATIAVRRAPPAEARAVRRHGESSRLWPRLDPPDVRADRLTARLGGRDPVGDRWLTLWWRRPDGAQPLARTRSARDGRFDFGEWPIPNGPQALVVTAEGEDPLAPTPTETHREVPAPIAVAFHEEDGIRVELHPATLEGELWLVDDRDVVLERLPAGGAARHFVLSDEAWSHRYGIVHVLPDGSRSARVTVRRATPHGHREAGPASSRVAQRIGDVEADQRGGDGHVE